MIPRDHVDHRILTDLVDQTTLVDLSALTAPRDPVDLTILVDPLAQMALRDLTVQMIPSDQEDPMCLRVLKDQTMSEDQEALLDL